MMFANGCVCQWLKNVQNLRVDGVEVTVFGWQIITSLKLTHDVFCLTF